MTTNYFKDTVEFKPWQESGYIGIGKPCKKNQWFYQAVDLGSENHGFRKFSSENFLNRGFWEGHRSDHNQHARKSITISSYFCRTQTIKITPQDLLCSIEGCLISWGFQSPSRSQHLTIDLGYVQQPAIPLDLARYQLKPAEVNMSNLQLEICKGCQNWQHLSLQEILD